LSHSSRRAAKGISGLLSVPRESGQGGWATGDGLCLDFAAELGGNFPVGPGMSPPTLAVGQRSALVLGFIVALVLVGLMVDDRQNLDEAEGGSQASQGRRLVGVELGHRPAG
jgi:hypothetical protein